MDFVTLGRTGLRASVAGLGCGGPSRLGQQTGNTETESIAVVRQALDLGINFIDTAEAYGTEPMVGRALADVPREQVILSTKKGIRRDGQLISADELRAGLEGSLQRLGADYVDVYHLHAVTAEDYSYARTELAPMLKQLQSEGKVRFLGITERFHADTDHSMADLALDDDLWDVMMIGFNILNQSARTRVFPRTLAQEVGVLCMFAVRRALSRPERLREILTDLAEQGRIDSDRFDWSGPLDFLLHGDGAAASIMDAAYRFCRYEPGMHVVLTGTGNRQHLIDNVTSLLRPPLPAEQRAHLMDLFAGVDNVSGG